MGSTGKYLIIIMILIPVFSVAQEKPDYLSVDSLTYRYYISGDWDKLISTGRNAIDSGLDYKYLRQRMGHAYFLKGNYFKAKTHFGKALAFDSFDQFSLEYLYYSYLNTGKEGFAGVLEERMHPQLKNSLKAVGFKPLESFELEFNYKVSGSTLRSDGLYYRFGAGSLLSNRVSLYQSFSNYAQTIIPTDTSDFMIKQPEYYVLVNWNLSMSLMLRTAYHYIHTVSGNSLFRGNLFRIALAPDFNRFIFEANGSLTNMNGYSIYQTGFEAGFVFPGRSNFYLKETAAWLFQPNGNSFVHSPKAGLMLWKGFWLEGNATIGRMFGYNDFNGLYVYNSYDQIVLRSGAGIVYYSGKHLAFWANYTFEKKEFFENNSFHYNQFSFLGGIKWKI